MDVFFCEMIVFGMFKVRFELDEYGNEIYFVFQEDIDVLLEIEFVQEIVQWYKVISDFIVQYKVVNEWLSGNKEYVRYIYRE